MLLSINSAARGLPAQSAQACTAIGLLLATAGRLPLIVRPVFELFRQALPCDTLGYFWADEQGNMTNAFVEQPLFLRADVVMSCMRYQQADPANWPSFNENVLQGPVAGYLLPYQTPAFYRSSHFDETYARIGARHILDVVVHDGARPFGCFLVMRSAESGPFFENDLETGRRLCAMLLLHNDVPAAPFQATRFVEAGRLLVGKAGEVIFADEAAQLSLWMMAQERGAPPFGTPDEGIEALLARALADEIARARVTGRVRAEFACPWGDFRTDLLADGDRVFLSIGQLEPYHAELARRLARSDLTARKIAICWLLVAGAQRKEIAHLLDISIDTLSEHITAIYKALRVKSASELVVRLVS
jgi:DNA-binding CsgD family transcriptional regulator